MRESFVQWWSEVFLPWIGKFGSEERDPRLDLIKGVCILGVVGIHFGGSFAGRPEIRWSPSFYTGLYWNQIFTFAVPVFFFVAGVLSSGKDIENLYAFFWKRISRLLPLCFVASLVWCLGFREAPFVANLNWEKSPNNFLFRFFYRGIHGTYFFVSAMLQVSLLTPLVFWIVGKCRKKMGGYALAVIGSILLLIHFCVGWVAFSNTKTYFGEFAFFYFYLCLPFGLFWLIYYFLGLYAQEIFGAILDRFGYWIPFVIGLITTVSVQIWNLCGLNSEIALGSTYLAYARPIMMAYSLGVVLCLGLVLKNTKPSVSRFWTIFVILGAFSYEIYLFHLVLMQYFGWGTPWSGKSIVQWCEEFPILIVVVCAVVCSILAVLSILSRILKATHRHFISR